MSTKELARAIAKKQQGSASLARVSLYPGVE
jgi:hypothetical protein